MEPPAAHSSVSVVCCLVYTPCQDPAAEARLSPAVNIRYTDIPPLQPPHANRRPFKPQLAANHASIPPLPAISLSWILACVEYQYRG